MNIEDCLASKPANMENFGSLQYIIDRLPLEEQLVVTEYFVHETSKADIARLTGLSVEVINRILRNLQRIDLTGNKPTITFRGKRFDLRGLRESY